MSNGLRKIGKQKKTARFGFNKLRQARWLSQEAEAKAAREKAQLEAEENAAAPPSSQP